MNLNKTEPIRPDRVRAKLLKRMPASEARNAAMDRAHCNLAAATEVFEHQGDGGRLGVFLAVDAAYQYFTSRGIPPAALDPLLAISAAIVDAERGTSSPIFAPRRQRSGGTPPSRAMDVLLDGHLAVITEACVRHCKSQGMRPYLQPASILASQMVNASKWPITTTAKELREVRERVRQCRNSKSPDRIAFDTQTTSIVFQERPLAWANSLLSSEWVIVPRGEVSV